MPKPRTIFAKGGKKLEPMTFVLFGATGDLAKRKIFPALYNLFVDNKLPKPISVVALGRREMSDSELQAYVKESIKTFSRRNVNEDANLEEFLQAFRPCVFDATNKEDYSNLLKLVKQ